MFIKADDTQNRRSCFLWSSLDSWQNEHNIIVQYMLTFNKCTKTLTCTTIPGLKCSFTECYSEKLEEEREFELVGDVAELQAKAEADTLKAAENTNGAEKPTAQGVYL